MAGSLHGYAEDAKGDLSPRSGRRVVVIGGGWGGATAAKYIRLGDPTVEVVLLEPNRQFVPCPFSNRVLSGIESLDALTLGYDRLRAHRVRSRHEAATAIEPDRTRSLSRRTTRASGRRVVPRGTTGRAACGS